MFPAKEVSKRKVVVVTGASNGIGKACALAFLKSGWDTVFVSRNQGSLDEVIAAVEDNTSGANAFAISCDISDSESVDKLFAAVLANVGRIDLVFNNAGISGPAGTIDEISIADWEETVATNLNGSFLVARAAFAQMKKQYPQGGRIINNGSIAAHTPRPKTVAYSVTKHAITGLTKCLALDGRAFNIACGQIDIGNVLTDMTMPFTQGMLQASGERMNEPVFDMQHVIDAVLYMGNLPPEANVQFMTVLATNMPYIGRG